MEGQLRETSSGSADLSAAMFVASMLEFRSYSEVALPDLLNSGAVFFTAAHRKCRNAGISG